MMCNRCGQEGHMVRDCTEEEKTRQWTNEEGEIKETYVPKADVVAEELFKMGISSGINFAKYENIPVSVTGDNAPIAIAQFTAAGLRPMLMENVTKCGYKIPTPVQKNAIPIIMAGRDLMAYADGECHQMWLQNPYPRPEERHPHHHGRERLDGLCSDRIWEDCGFSAADHPQVDFYPS